jgi:hypothetical protein
MTFIFWVLNRGLSILASFKNSDSSLEFSGRRQSFVGSEDGTRKRQSNWNFASCCRPLWWPISTAVSLCPGLSCCLTASRDLGPDGAPGLPLNFNVRSGNLCFLAANATHQ